MQLTFVVDDVLESGQRKRSPRACDQCKVKKKRCTHSSAWQTVSSKRSNNARRGGATNTRATQNHASNPSRASAPASTRSTAVESDSEFVSCAESPSLEEEEESRARQRRHDSSLDRRLSGPGSPARSQRFIGDLNPETVFYSDANAVADGDLSKQNDVGLWVSGVRRKRQDGTTSTADRDSTSAESCARGQKRTLVLESQALPSLDTQWKLIDVYFSKIHPLLPLLDEESFRQVVSNNSASPLLIKAICLAASKDSSAAAHLRFQDDPSPLPAREFGRRVHADLSSRRIEEEERNMATAVTCLALMSLHTEGSDGGERSSWNLMRAIHLAQTIGLHLGRERRKTKESKSLLLLFWSLWSLDRINAAVNGRPVMMHDRDIGLRAEDSWRLFDAPFRVWLRIAQVLDKVIELYRPAAAVSAGGAENSFPGFEDLVDQCDGWGIEQNTLVSLEIFHHAVWILSCRLRTVNQHPSSSISYLRQSSSARQIASILQLHSLSLLSPLPIIPYAISLSLAVAYKQLRQTKLATTRAVTQAQLVVCSQALDELSGTWWSAATMAKLAKQALFRLESGPQAVGLRRVDQGNSLQTLPNPDPATNLAQTSAAPASSSSNMVLNVSTGTGSHGERPYQQPPGTGSGHHSADFQHPRPNGEASYPNTIQQDGSPFATDPSSLATVPSASGPNANFWAADGMDEIDAFLGNFLDLRSCAYMAHDMEFLDSLTEDAIG